MTLADQARAYVARNRARKACQLAFHCWAFGIPAENLRLAEDEHWKQLALAANCNPPSPETRQMTIDTLRKYEEKGVIAA